MANTIFHFEFFYSLNVQIEGLRAFAQSRLTARLGIIITANTKGKTWPLGLRRKTRHSRLRGNDGFFRGALNLFGLSRTLQYITENPESHRSGETMATTKSHTAFAPNQD